MLCGYCSWLINIRNHVPTLKVLSREIHPAEIRFIWKAFIEERGAEVFRKIGPSPILWEPFKDSAPSRTAFSNSKTNSQRGNEIHRAVGIGGTCVSLELYQRLNLVFPFSLKSPQFIGPGPNIANGIIAQLSTSRIIHCAVANILEGS